MIQWNSVPFWSIARRMERSGNPDGRLLSVYRDWGVVPKDSRDDNFNQASDDLSTYKVVYPRDLVLNKMKTWQGSLGVSNVEGIVSPAYFVCELTPAVDARFIHHLLRSDPSVSEFKAHSKGIRPNQWDLPYDALRDMRLRLPPMEEQRRIADFLDDRVARIDQIIAARAEQQQRIGATRDAIWSAMTSQLDGPDVPIRRFMRSIVDGPFGSSLKSDHYSSTGTRVIRLGNIGIGRFRNEDHAYIPDEYAEMLGPHAVVAGDLIMAGLGDERWPLGRCAVVPVELGPAIVKADCYRIRLDSRVDHRFAAAALSAPNSRSRIQLLSRGATRARLNTEVAREATLPLVSLEVQQAYVQSVDELQSDTDRSGRLLDAQVRLLQEYKQSLITAAVSGELDVTTASTRIPE